MHFRAWFEIRSHVTSNVADHFGLCLELLGSIRLGQASNKQQNPYNNAGYQEINTNTQTRHMSDKDFPITAREIKSNSPHLGGALFTIFQYSNSIDHILFIRCTSN